MLRQPTLLLYSVSHKYYPEEVAIFNQQTSHSNQRSRSPMMAERAVAAQAESVSVTCESKYEACCLKHAVLWSVKSLAFWRKVSGPELRDIICIKQCSVNVAQQSAVSALVTSSHSYVASYKFHLSVLVLHHHPPHKRVQWTLQFN